MYERLCKQENEFRHELQEDRGKQGLTDISIDPYSHIYSGLGDRAGVLVVVDSSIYSIYRYSFKKEKTAYVHVYIIGDGWFEFSGSLSSINLR